MRPRVFLWIGIVIVVLIGGSFVFATHDDPSFNSTMASSSAPIVVNTADVYLARASDSSSSPSLTPDIAIHSDPLIAAADTEATSALGSAATPAQWVAERIANPYSTPPLTIEQGYAYTYKSLVNILCVSSGDLHTVSGSGVIVDPRGVILTNAHVAQYVLLSENPDLHLSCVVRMGSPAESAWKAGVLYMPQAWAQKHAPDINLAGQATGTGEHDYAFLLIKNAAPNSGFSLPPSGGFANLPIDAREAIGFVSDDVIAASYPAEFMTGAAVSNSLYPAASETGVTQLITFGSGKVDLLSIRGVVEAQSGSSGGAIVNPWGYLIGLITTTSGGATVDVRELHALTLSYINRDLIAEKGQNLSQFLSGDLKQKESDFNGHDFPTLMNLYLAQIRQNS